MATNRIVRSTRSRRDSTESTASLWEKFYERVPQTQQDAPFATDENIDLIEQNPTLDDYEEYETDSDAPSSPPTSLPPSIPNDQSKPWENSTPQDHLTIIINDNQTSDKDRRSLKNDLSRQGLKWTDDEEELRPWHFGLTAIRLEFTQPRMIDLQLLCLSSRIPFWLKLKSEKQKPILKDNTQKKPLFHKLPFDLDVALRYGAFIGLNEFRYSPQHSWKDEEDSKWSLNLDNQRNGGGHIEWVIQSTQMRLKKQLLIANINHSIIVDSDPEGFNIYICQKCNMNEFQADAKTKDNDKNNTDKHRSQQNNLNQSRNTSRDFPQQKAHQRPNSIHRAPQLLRPQKSNPRQAQRIFYEFYRRIGVHPSSSYFSTVQFSLRINPLRLRNNQTRNIQNQIKQTLSLLIDFFLAHRITVCYAKINSDKGPQPHLFFQENIPDFPSLIMKYSWQLLSINGYRLQLQIDQEFRQTLFEIHIREENPEELFYRVCVYLSRIFSLKPFLNINQELQHAINESKRKRDHAAYGLVRKLDFEGNNETYVPAVTITPTTIRIKPLKLCRTNRVLRATKEFGKAVEHFILVDIRDENGRDLQSYHFRDLRMILLDYLKKGFTLMNDNRQYQYLHHSQSQLRERQFWFYHHHDDENDSNLSFADAYSWMGKFDTERNPAKNAARIALCFSTTKATVQVSPKNVRGMVDITTRDGRLSFTDGCGTMSYILKNEIKQSLGMRADFSAVQFRYDGAKGVVSVDPNMPENIHLNIRKSMQKFDSKHECFEVCKVSAPRPLFLNRQAILLLSYRQVPDASFLILQQQNHLALIRALLRNVDAEKLILQKIPWWFLPRDIRYANIDYIHEPFFRQLLISSCLQSTRELLQRTRIRIPPNEGRNMIGIVDEYNVLKPDQVYIQYTVRNRDYYDDDENNNNNNKTKILDKCKVVITKNPCHHPGDIRTFTAIDHPQLAHLKDVIVFSQQGDRPAPHDISGSDLDGDEYLVLWHEDLVPQNTPNAEPYDYDACTPVRTYDDPVTRDDINETILNVAEQDCLGRLSNLHLAFADKFGVDDDDTRRVEGVLSTVGLAGAISQEVDSGKTGHHPLNENQIKKLNDSLGNQRPDFMDNPNFEKYQSEHILGKLYRASKRTVPGWNRLVRYHRHLRHLQVRTRDEPEEEEEDGKLVNNEEDSAINLDQSFLAGVDVNDRDYTAFANNLGFVYRQEILEILSLYGLSHESDLWCRNSTAGPSGELEDTAYTELDELVKRTKARFYFEQVSSCEVGRCHADTEISKLCEICKKRQQAIAVACYYTCYGGDNASKDVPILSLPWLFAGSLLQARINQEAATSYDMLSMGMKKAMDCLVFEKHHLILSDTTLKFRLSKHCLEAKITVGLSVCIFIEVVHQYLVSKGYSYWPLVLSRFIRSTGSYSPLPNQPTLSDEWDLIFESHKVNEEDMYAAMLLSIDWMEKENNFMHQYFEDILKICFDAGRLTNEIDFLNISDSIILLLQKVAIDGAIFSENKPDE